MLAIMSGFLHRLLLAVKPAPFQINNRERLRAMIGAGLAIFLTSQLSQWMVGDALHLYWMVGSLGATALLVFLLPGSPLAQPYAAVLGNTVGAVVGVLCAHLALPPVPSTGLAVAAAMAAMFLLRCVHPPGVAVALFASLTQITDFRFALMPIFTDTLLVVLLGVLYNNLTGKAYPYIAPPAPAPTPSGPALRRFSDADLDQALAQFNQALNISRSELAQVLQYAENATFERLLGGTRCRDIMSRDPLAAPPTMPQTQAWALMHDSQLKALPIVDEQHHLLGIATASDFVTRTNTAPEDTTARGWRLLWPRKKPTPGAAPTVGEIMTATVVHAKDSDPISALIPLFAQQRLRHIPVLDQDDKLCGIVTQSDLLQALYQSVYAPPA